MSESPAESKEKSRGPEKQRTPESEARAEKKGPTPEQRREIIDAMRAPEGDPKRDAVGAELLNGVKAGFENPNETPRFSKERQAALMWRKANEQAENIDNAGSANKLLLAMQSLHEQMGMKQYIPQVEFPEGASQAQKAESIKKKIEEDYRGFPEEAAIHSAEGYVNQKHEVEQKKKEVQEAIDNGTDHGKKRGEIRTKAFELKREQARLKREEKRISSKFKEGWRRTYVQAFSEDENKYKGEKFKKFADVDQGERAHAIFESDQKIKTDLKDQKGVGYVDSYNNIDEKARGDRLIEISKVDRLAGHLKEQLKQATEVGDTETVMALLDKIRIVENHSSEQKRGLQAQVNTQRLKDTKGEVSKSFEELSEAMSRGKNPLKALGNVREAMANRGNAKLSIVGHNLDYAVPDIFKGKGDNINVAINQGRDKLVNARDAIADTTGKYTVDSLKGVGKYARNKYRSGALIAKRIRVNTKLFQKEITQEAKIAKDSAFMAAGEIAKGQAQQSLMELGGKIGARTEEKKAKVEKNKGIIRKVTARKIDREHRNIREKKEAEVGSPNEFFNKLLLDHYDRLTEPPQVDLEEVTMPTTEAPSQSEDKGEQPQPEQEKSEQKNTRKKREVEKQVTADSAQETASQDKKVEEPEPDSKEPEQEKDNSQEPKNEDLEPNQENLTKLKGMFESQKRVFDQYNDLLGKGAIDKSNVDMQFAREQLEVQAQNLIKMSKSFDSTPDNKTKEALKTAKEILGAQQER